MSEDAPAKMPKKKGGCLRLIAMFAAAVLAIAVALFLAGYAIDGHVDLSTEAHVDAPPEEVFRYLGTTAGVVEWWTAVMEDYDGDGPAMDVIAGDGPAQGPGATVRFEAGGTVAEEWEIVRAEPPGSVTWNVDFQIMEVERTFTLTPEDGGTRVRWSETGEIENPLARWMSLAMGEDEVIANFEGALEGLGRVVEE